MGAYAVPEHPNPGMIEEHRWSVGSDGLTARANGGAVPHEDR